jgi:hypothetical protein
MVYIILLDIALFFFLVKTLIDISLFYAALKKSTEVVNIPNDKIKKYQYIKGLF